CGREGGGGVRSGGARGFSTVDGPGPQESRGRRTPDGKGEFRAAGSGRGSQEPPSRNGRDGSESRRCSVERGGRMGSARCVCGRGGDGALARHGGRSCNRGLPPRHRSLPRLRERRERGEGLGKWVCWPMIPAWIPSSPSITRTSTGISSG